MVTLGEGMTPLLDLPRHGARLGVPRLRMKDEGLVPTGAFKARGAAVGRVPGRGAGRHGDRDADQRQRRCGLGRLRRPRRTARR